MSEIDPRSEIIPEEQERRINTRRAELAPVLAGLVIKAKATYELLRPHAEHAGSVARDYPLRHQQVQGAGIGGPEGVAADYLMIAFGNDHDLTLSQSYTDTEAFNWHLERAVLIDNSLSERTKLEDPALPRIGFEDEDILGIEVVTYRYPKEANRNSRFAEGVCNHLNDYANAEKYVESFEADLFQAITRFS